MPTLTSSLNDPAPLPTPSTSDAGRLRDVFTAEQLVSHATSLVVVPFVVMQVLVLILADAVHPVKDGFYTVALLAGLFTTGAGCVGLAILVRRLLARADSHEQSHSLWSFIDHSSVVLAVAPGMMSLVAGSVAGLAVNLAGGEAPTGKLFWLSIVLAGAVFPGLNVLLCLSLGRLAGLRHDQLLQSVGRRAKSMMTLGARVGMAMVFSALLPVVWTLMLLLRASEGHGLTLGGNVAIFPLACALLVVAGFNAYAFRAWLHRITLGLRGQLAQLHSGASDRPPFLGLDEAGSLTGDAAEAAQHISELAARLQRVADGDLTVTFPDQSVLSLAARRVTESMLALVDRVAHAAAKVQDDAHHVLETALDVEASAQEQSLNVDESRRTMQGLRQCSSEINSESRELASASEDVLSVTENTASQISQLVEHQVQIEELLDTVREIAERSDILALNASLEGVRAGEAGRGFSLVAAEMRRMAEKVKSAANDIRQTVSNVRSSARATMMGIEEGRRVGDRMKKSVERILLMAMQQQSSTAQVNNNMSDVASYLQDATGDTARARELAESLTNRASSLLELVEQWNLPEAEDWGQTGSLGGVEFDSDDNIIFRPSGRQAATDPTTARATAASSSDDASGSPDPATPPDAQPE